MRAVPPHPRRPDIAIPAECRALIERGALVAVNSSGGKDSQAMAILLSRVVPREQLLIVHAPLGEVEWPGTIEHTERTIPAGVPLILARTASGKSLLERIEDRGWFPSAHARYCTSDAKRTPIERELHRYLKAHPRFPSLVVNAMGMRASESPARSKLSPWRRNDRNSRAAREWFDWLPIQGLETADVFHVISIPPADSASPRLLSRIQLLSANTNSPSVRSCHRLVYASRRAVPGRWPTSSSSLPSKRACRDTRASRRNADSPCPACTGSSRRRGPRRVPKARLRPCRARYRRP